MNINQGHSGSGACFCWYSGSKRAKRTHEDIDGKRLDGLSLIPWKAGKPLTWDVMVASTLTASYVDTYRAFGFCSGRNGSNREVRKIRQTGAILNFQPLAFENLRTMNESCFECICDPGNATSSVTGDCLEARFLLQRIWVTIQRFNAIYWKTVSVWQRQTRLTAIPAFNPRDLNYRGYLKNNNN